MDGARGRAPLSLELASARLAKALRDAGVDAGKVEVHLPLDEWKKLLRATEEQTGIDRYDGIDDAIAIAGIRYFKIFPR